MNGNAGEVSSKKDLIWVLEIQNFNWVIGSDQRDSREISAAHKFTNEKYKRFSPGNKPFLWTKRIYGGFHPFFYKIIKPTKSCSEEAITLERVSFDCFLTTFFTIFKKSISGSRNVLGLFLSFQTILL